MKYYGKIRDPKDLITLEKGEELVENKITEPSDEGTDGQVLTTDGEGGRTWKTVDSLPEQSGQNGKFLSTDGTSASWEEIARDNDVYIGTEEPAGDNKPLLWVNPDERSGIIDSVPIENSGNLVYSGGVYSAIEASSNGKVNNPAIEGTAGQVLCTDGAGGTYWGEGGGGGGGTWGNITGNISSQTDLSEVVSPLINLWDEQWEQGRFNPETDADIASTARIRSKVFPIKPNTTYFCYSGGTKLHIVYYDASKNYLTHADNVSGVFTTPSNAMFMRFCQNADATGTYANNISINYPSTYTGYYPSALPKEKAHIGGLGNAIAMKGWNQLITGKIETNNWGGVTVTETNGRITGSGTVATIFEALMQNYIPVKEGHKYYLKTPKVYTNLRWELYPLSFTEHTGSRSEHEIILTANTARQIAIYARGNSGDFISVDGYFQFIDLTALFGAGNEPSSVEDFRAMFPADYYPYYLIGGFTSNRNLLDNGWFTVNQRGQTSYTDGVYTVDRWMLFGTGDSLIVNNDGTVTLNMPAGRTFRHMFENGILKNNEVYTVSIMGNDGTIISTQIRYIEGSERTVLVGYFGSVRLYVELDGRNVAKPALYIYSPYAWTATLRAVKLELGSVSTLANDAPPNYAEELTKCQRYFVRLNGYDNYFGTWAKNGAENGVYVYVTLPTKLRTNPTITSNYNLSSNEVFLLTSGNRYGALRQINGVSGISGNIVTLNALTDANMGTNYCTVGICTFNRNDIYFDFSAEL